MIIDATERRHYRPENKEERDPLYSGKKKTFTVKNTVICSLRKFIGFSGRTTQGSIHDKALLCEELPDEEKWFDIYEVLVDLGYVGIQDNYEIKNLRIPVKRKRGKKDEPKTELTDEEKQYNKELSRTRVLAENALSGLKRFSILVNVFRNKILNFDDLTIGIPAGIWNLHLSI